MNDDNTHFDFMSSIVLMDFIKTIKLRKEVDFLNQIPATAKIVITEITLLLNLNVFDHFYEALVREIIICLYNSEK